MLKGVNRQVVEIPQPDSAYFEKVIFFVKPEFSGASELKLRSSADSLIKSASPPPSGKRRVRKYPGILQAVKFALAGVAGAVISAISFMVMQ